MKYDVIIVGAGPSGIFTALELAKKKGIRILLLEKGRELKERIKLIKNAECRVQSTESEPSPTISGWGGAGAFSDGKLTLSSDVGGFLYRYLDQGELTELIKYVDKCYVHYGAPDKTYGSNTAEIERLKTKAARNNLKLIPTRIRHIGTDRCPEVLQNFKNGLKGKVEIKFNTNVKTIIKNGSKIAGIATEEGREFISDFVVLSPGRGGAGWLDGECRRIGLTTLINPVDIGVRVELPAATLSSVTDAVYEPKLLFYSKQFDDQVRTFCVNPYGAVVQEFNDGIFTVNGHSYTKRKSDNTNFAILVSTTFTKPFNEPISYGKYVARLANFLSDGIIVQRLGDLLKGRRSTADRIKRGIVTPTLKTATPGDLSFVLPYRFLADILEMMESLDKFAPGICSGHTLLYGIEVKFYSLRLKLTKSLETEVKNLFAVGDGAGVSRGLIQASASGVIAAREILKRF
ncbi:MAG: NAD(P)/FAD-dependent oxidoreductase [Nitrospinae bacterium]|nr:NAD(P)/FAD-dependent oxidoreductase [Nitrospinota bacterium]